MSKVCILAAGKGSRCDVTVGLHKALLPINNMPMISHIFKCIPESFEIIIAIGYKSDQVKTYVNNVYPDKNIKFVDVENYDGEGSGPGLSLLCCKDHLKSPFIFMPVDTYTPNFVFEEVCENWVGAVDIPSETNASYCLISGKRRAGSIGYKDGNFAFNGIAGVFDYSDFWRKLEDKTLIKNEHQVINGLRGLKKLNIKYFKNFYDTGNTKSYISVRNSMSKEIVLPKSSESIYIDNGKVIKYFNDKEKAKLRIKRSKILKDFVPSVKKINESMYMYDYIQADLLSNIYSEKIFDQFLSFVENDLHLKRYPKSAEFLDNCKIMYRNKTESRANGFAGTDTDNIEEINGVSVSPIKKLLEQIDWQNIYNSAIPSNIHGDLQPENILFNNKFVLIDWREDFGNSIAVGDLYYDLSKLYHALLINGSHVLNNNYDILIFEKKAFLNYSVKNNLLVLLDKLKDYCHKNKYSWNNVVLLGILHYINIAPFYKDYGDGRYSRFIFLLGKYLLTKYLEDKNEF